MAVSELLYLVASLEHQYFVVGFTRCLELSHAGYESLQAQPFQHLEENEESLKTVQLLFLSQLDALPSEEIVGFSRKDGKQILGHFHHQDAVIPLGSDGSVGAGHELTEKVSCEEALASRSLPEERTSAFSVPAHHCLIDAANYQQIILVGFLVSEGSFGVVVQHVQGQSLGHHWNQSVFLKLVVENWSLGKPVGTDSLALLRILDC